jgi:hypothetical protein
LNSKPEEVGVKGRTEPINKSRWNKSTWHVHVFELISIPQKGLRMALHLHTTGGNSTGGSSGPLTLRGVYIAPIGATMRVASMRVVGQVFHEKLMPSSSSCMAGSKGSGGGGAAIVSTLSDEGNPVRMIFAVVSE